MTPFEVIISVMIYIALGHFLLKENEGAINASSGAYTIGILLWPVVLVGSLFVWE